MKGQSVLSSPLLSSPLLSLPRSLPPLSLTATLRYFPLYFFIFIFICFFLPRSPILFSIFLFSLSVCLPLHPSNRNLLLCSDLQARNSAYANEILVNAAPEMLNYRGLQDRDKTNALLKRPVDWKEYCAVYSGNNCGTGGKFISVWVFSILLPSLLDLTTRSAKFRVFAHSPILALPFLRSQIPKRLALLTEGLRMHTMWRLVGSRTTQAACTTADLPPTRGTLSSIPTAQILQVS